MFGRGRQINQAKNETRMEGKMDEYNLRRKGIKEDKYSDRRTLGRPETGRMKQETGERGREGHSLGGNRCRLETLREDILLEWNII